MPLDLGADFVPGATATAEGVNDKFNAIEAWANGEIDLGDIADLVTEALVPVGTILATARSTAPSGYVLCDGTSYSTSGTYAALFAAIGYGYGGSGGNFNVPDLRGRVPVGVDGAAARLTANDARGNVGGEQNHTLAASEMPVHSHTTTLAGHTTILSLDGQSALGAWGYGVNGWHTSPSFASNNAGSGGSHNIMQPYQVVNYMVKI